MRVDDPELLDLVELEVRELLKAYQYPATTCRDSFVGFGRVERRREVGEAD